MELRCTDDLREYMQKTNKHIIIVEVAVSDGSDFEVAELHIHFTSEKQAELFQTRKKYHRFETEWGIVLLPNYRLEYQEVVTFDIKKILFFHVVTQTGIKL